jgi:hypothetical protein
VHVDTDLYAGLEFRSLVCTDTYKVVGHVSAIISRLITLANGVIPILPNLYSSPEATARSASGVLQSLYGET